MWVGDGKTRGGVPAPWRGHNDLPDVSYDDIVVSPQSFSVAGGTALSYETWLTNLKVVRFASGTTDVGYFTVQLPHGYVPGADIHPHVHFSNPVAIADGATVVFTLVYTRSSIWGVFPATASVNMTFTNNAATRSEIQAKYPGTVSGTNIVVNSHLIAGGATISGAGLGLSSLIHCKIGRGADTHAQNVYMVSADFHIQKNRMGTEREYA
jgi:phage baseplate assembly protein gpV